jgi:hypothetical protein
VDEIRLTLLDKWWYVREKLVAQWWKKWSVWLAGVFGAAATCIQLMSDSDKAMMPAWFSAIAFFIVFIAAIIRQPALHPPAATDAK